MTEPTTGTPVEPRPAATVVLLRQGGRGRLEALLTHRPATMAFAPDVHVFPGGRVDAADTDPRLTARSPLTPTEAAERLGGDLQPAAALATYIAAIREVFEEVGVLLADHRPGADLASARSRLLADPTCFAELADALDLRLRTDMLVALSRWVTPTPMPRRFDARFFAAAMPRGAEVSLEGGEVVAQAWFEPLDALERMAHGDLSLWLPTSTTLQQLAYVDSMATVAAALEVGRLGTTEIESIAPVLTRITMPAGGGVAGQPVCAYLVGRRQFVLVDPGDPTGPGLDAAMDQAAARGGSIVAIALTHADPDHAAGAEALAQRLGIPVYVGADGGRYLPYQTRPALDGRDMDLGDVPLRVIAAPGPTPDHHVYRVGAGEWLLAGDLDGRRGARMVLGPVDRAAWYRSIAAVRSQAPTARWLPGHPA